MRGPYPTSNEISKLGTIKNHFQIQNRYHWSQKIENWLLAVEHWLFN